MLVCRNSEFEVSNFCPVILFSVCFPSRYGGGTPGKRSIAWVAERTPKEPQYFQGLRKEYSFFISGHKLFPVPSVMDAITTKTISLLTSRRENSLLSKGRWWLLRSWILGVGQSVGSQVKCYVGHSAGNRIGCESISRQHTHHLLRLQYVGSALTYDRKCDIEVWTHIELAKEAF